VPAAPAARTPLQAVELLGLLAEPDRLRVAAALILGAGTPTEVAAAAEVDLRSATRALARLESAADLRTTWPVGGCSGRRGAG
jgi:hypothetical protein